MYYTPAVTIPGKIAHIKLENARASAKLNRTYVMDEDGNIVEDYRTDRR